MSSSSRPLLDAADAEGGDPIAPTDEGAPTATDVSFAPLSDGAGVEVVDPVDRHRYALETGDVSPVPTDTGEFLFPVDAAIEVTTDAITLPTVVAVCVRNQSGMPLFKAEHNAERELPAGTYSVELLAPIRIYLRVEGSLRVASDADRVRIEFGDETTVGIGARSHHERPAGTVTVTDDPADLMAAVSTFGSALATTSPERSYPSFRGHPPLIERGDELAVPEGLAPPETGLRIEVPAEHRAVYAVAPLAYYLGARVVPGAVPRIVTDAGFEHRLDAPAGRNDIEGSVGDGFETAVARALKQTFLLDCVTRTEGIYPVELRERNALEDTLELDFADLYDRPIAERVEAYLGVPYSVVEPHLPEWKLTTHIEPTPESAEALPFAANDLAVVRTPRSGELSVSEERAAAIDQQTEVLDDFLRSASRGETTEPDVGEYVELAGTDSLESVWVGEGRPLNAGKATVEAYRSRLDREPTDGDIEVAVVCNDIDRAGEGRTGMDDEHAAVDEMYGGRLSLPFEVTVHHDLTTDELRGVLAADADFLHYIGHIDERGFECPDGLLDVRSLDSVGADAFFLNACQSYEQGMAMLDAGAIGGIVTLIDVVNEGALALGKAIPQLLNAGFSLGSALEIARSEAVAGQRYLTVGDQGLWITQAESGVPTVCEVIDGGESFEVGLTYYPTTETGMGSVSMPHFKQSDEYFLSAGQTGTFDVSPDELGRFFDLEDGPVRVNEELRWSQSIDVDNL